MTILVTGGNGFVGRNLVPRLVASGRSVLVLDDFSTGVAPPRWEGDVSVVNGSVADRELLRRLFRESDIELVYHLAAVVGVKNYIERPFDLVDVNIGGTRVLLEECIRKGIKMTFASTSEVFGKNPKVPWAEDDDRVVGTSRAERWLYGNTKAVCEHLLFSASKRLSLQMGIVRYYNLYGPGQYPLNVVPRWICRALAGKPLLVHGDGEMVRCFTFIEDAIEATILVAEKTSGEAFNIGSAKPIKVRDLAQKILEKTHSKAGIAFASPHAIFGNGFEEIYLRIPNVDKARKLLGWHASTTLDEGLGLTVSWYDENRSWWRDLDY
jgi:UDP-glucose 4-epimerase